MHVRRYLQGENLSAPLKLRDVFLAGMVLPPSMLSRIMMLQLTRIFETSTSGIDLAHTPGRWAGGHAR